MLEQSLMDAYTIYHGVHWTRVGNGFSMFGEIDFVVVNPAGSMLLIEQNVQFALAVGDRYAVLKRGEIVDRGVVGAAGTAVSIAEHLAV